jgi:GTP-binding protein HflX
MSERPAHRPTAILVGVQLPGVGDAEYAADLAELARLVDTLGYDVTATVTQRRETLSKSVVLGEGKLKELAELTGGRGYVPSAVPVRKDKARQRREEEGGEGDDEVEFDDFEDDAGQVPIVGKDVPEDSKKRPALVAVDHLGGEPRVARALDGAAVVRGGPTVGVPHRVPQDGPPRARDEPGAPPRPRAAGPRSPAPGDRGGDAGEQQARAGGAGDVGAGPAVLAAAPRRRAGVEKRARARRRSSSLACAASGAFTAFVYAVSPSFAARPKLSEWTE